jgi:hypothetical protein
MIDELSIQQTINRYSVGASQANWDAVLSTFVADGVWKVPALGVTFRGHKEIREGLIHFSSPNSYIVQLNTPALIEVDGDRASAQSVIRECGKYKDRDEAIEVLGLYLDKLVRTPQGWRFSERVFELKGLHNFPVQVPAPQ